ncbi:hypothetical protein CCR75_006110 [Bremia lactucae]|uniref:Uncharacterized protein n=1 Tax=Bremia lactucae TaxID=4779 RepID=A0A976II26_BRELC|nr:hypothetical protein CCR75_006110 [Bremia lactucae]
MATPSPRRSSINSVPSSGRRQKEKSLHDIVATMEQNTIKSPPAGDNGVLTSSRQLDFGSVNERDVNDAEDEDQVKIEPVESDEIEVDATRHSKRRRRGKVCWSAEEEEFLRQGVKKHGVGKWQNILIEGKNIFLNRRTNVDLKDKWKNLTKNTKRKLHKTRNFHDNVDERTNETVKAASSKRPSVSPVRLAATTNRNHDEDGQDNTDTLSLEDESSPIPEAATLRCATDKSFPDLIEIKVQLDACNTIASLVKYLRSSILSDASENVDIQVIGIKSRVCFQDDELLSRCITVNGGDFYFVYDNNPEEFV